MKATQHRQKHCADKRRKDLEFKVGDHLFLKVSPVRDVFRFHHKRGKLSPRYIGPFKIVESVGKVAYRLALLPKMSSIHNVFHISIMRKYIHADTHVIIFDDFEINNRVTFKKDPCVSWSMEPRN